MVQFTLQYTSVFRDTVFVYFLALLGVGLTDKQSCCGFGNVDFRAVISVPVGSTHRNGDSAYVGYRVGGKDFNKILISPVKFIVYLNIQIYGVDHGPVKTIGGGKVFS